ncbi:hypothetical protein ACFL0C_00960, partial [Patescibacteria group bacterium]
MVTGAEKFSEFANFEFNEDKTPDLPIRGSAEIINAGKYHGGFSTSIEIDENDIAKINRVLRVDTEEFAQTGEFPNRQYPDSLAAVAERVEIPDDADEEKKENIRLATEATLRLAKIKRETHETLQEYIGDYLPELKFYAVVESPRRVLEERQLNNRFGGEDGISEEILQNIPTSEITLLEVWENVGPKNSLDNIPYDKLANLYTDEKFLEHQKEFAKDAYKLFMERGIMLDISDMAGIRYKTKEGRIEQTVGKSGRFYIEQAMDIFRGTEQDIIPIPRNVAYKDGKFMYYDVYPAWQIPSKLPEKFLADLTTLMSQGDEKGLQEILFNKNRDGYMKGRLNVFHYLTLLKSMGLDSFEIDEPDLDS